MEEDFLGKESYKNKINSLESKVERLEKQLLLLAPNSIKNTEELKKHKQAFREILNRNKTLLRSFQNSMLKTRIEEEDDESIYTEDEDIYETYDTEDEEEYFSSSERSSPSYSRISAIKKPDEYDLGNRYEHEELFSIGRKSREDVDNYIRAYKKYKDKKNNRKSPKHSPKISYKEEKTQTAPLSYKPVDLSFTNKSFVKFDKENDELGKRIRDLEKKFAEYSIPEIQNKQKYPFDSEFKEWEFEEKEYDKKRRSKNWNESFNAIKEKVKTMSGLHEEITDDMKDINKSINKSFENMKMINFKLKEI